MFLMPYIYFLFFAVGPKQCLQENCSFHFILIAEEGVDVEDGANASNAR